MVFIHRRNGHLLLMLAALPLQTMVLWSTTPAQRERETEILLIPARWSLHLPPPNFKSRKATGRQNHKHDGKLKTQQISGAISNMIVQTNHT